MLEREKKNITVIFHRTIFKKNAIITKNLSIDALKLKQKNKIKQRKFYIQALPLTNKERIARKRYIKKTFYNRKKFIKNKKLIKKPNKKIEKKSIEEFNKNREFFIKLKIYLVYPF